MKTILIKEGCPNPISLGEKGENGVSAVLFDYSEWISDFGEGAISLLVKRKGDASAYPVVLSTADGIATWTISDTDTAVQGYGKAEYIFTIDDKIAKSAVFSFYVAADLGPSGDPPDPYESWIDTLTALGGETLINAQAAQAAQTAAETAQTAAETAATNAATSATNSAQSAGAARFAAESALASADSASASATTATASATAAEASETAAYDSANTAAEEAELAQTAATNAQQSATNAATYVTQSANNAAQAIEAASDAEEADRIATQAATSATQSANNASQSASAASGSATAAASSATNAASSATSASGSATNAATSATNAATSATGAAASATAAAQSATEAAESAASASYISQLPTDTASGAIASFPDGADNVPVEALSVALEPIQDLHGYDAPWTAGGGKNLADYATEYTPTVGINNGTVKLFSADLTAGETYTFSCKQSVSVPTSTRNTLVIVESGGTYKYESTSTNFNPTNLRHVYTFTATVTGTCDFYIWIHTPSVAATYSEWQVEKGSSFTGYAPYENICPISGHDSVGIWGDSAYDKNIEWNQLLPIYATDNTTERNGVLIKDNRDGSYTLNGTATASANHPIYRNIAFENGHAYFINSSGNVIITNDMGFSTARGSRIQIATASRIVAFSFYLALGDSFSDTVVWPFVCDLTQIFGAGNEPSTVEEFRAMFPNDYYPYNAGELTCVSAVNGRRYKHAEVQLGQTVYGGTLDVTSGKFVADRAMVTFDGSADEVWSVGMSPSGHYRSILYISGLESFGLNNSPSPYIFSNTFKVGTWNNVFAGNLLIGQTGTAIGVGLDSFGFTTVNEWLAWLGQNNLQVCYTLAEPIEIQLSDIPELTTLYGQNNIWSDSGDVSVEYRADIQKYIAKVIAEALA